MNNYKKIPVAIIGGGINSAVGYAHYSAINLSNKFDITAGVFSRASKINNDTGKIYQINDNKIYQNYKLLLDKEKNNIQAVIILTPSTDHIDHIKEAIKNKIPVICEKPLTTNIKDAIEIKSLLKDNFLAVVYNYICYPSLIELKELIKNKKLGNITHIQLEMPQEGFSRKRNNKPIIPQKWRLKDKEIPMISLDLGIHLHSIIKYLINEKPIEIIGTSDSYGNFKIIDNINCIINYEKNIKCNLWYGKSSIGNKNGLKIRIFGTKASAEWYQYNPEILKIADDSGKEWIINRGSDECLILNKPEYNRFKAGHPAGYIEALANFYENAAEDLNNQNNSKYKRKTFGINQSIEGLKLFQAAQESSLKKKWIKI